MDRRQFLKASALSGLFFFPGLSGWAFSQGDAAKDPVKKRLIVVFLRGGMDGLNVVVPYGDPNYYLIRPTIAVAKPGSDFGAVDLNGFFGINPGLNALMPLWQNKSLAFIHASGSPDPTRSHFDAQDFMESGLPGDKFASTGWLNRVVGLMPTKNHSPVQAISVGPILPRIFTGPNNVATVENARGPSNLPVDKPQVAKAFEAMYGGDDPLSKAYAEGVAAHKTINTALTPPEQKEQVMANRGAPPPNTTFGRQLAKLFTNDPTVQLAFIDFGGWDTHVGEGNGRGQLANRLTPLATGLADLADGLGPLYSDTTIVVMSEFGRTAKENGNGGTDHGHGNVMMVMGGGTQGGQVYGRFSSLAQNDLHEQRDLPITTDFRNVLSFLLNEQLELPKSAISQVFPDYKADANPFIIT